jgi:tetratricopeptide (TPR) repeat protein
MYRSYLFLTAALTGTTVALIQPAVSAKSASEVETIARSVTVEIKRQEQQDNGSGIIIHKQGDLYTLVTNRHVICSSSNCNRIPVNEVFTLELSDGLKYKVPNSSIRLLGSSDNIVDLAIIQFRSNRNYPVAKVAAPGSLKVEDAVYASGFPCDRNSIPCQPFGYAFQKGEAIAVVTKRLTGDNGGYTIVYDAETLPGMSGGGVFNSSGELVAIHGHGDRFKQNTDLNNKFRVGSKIGLNRGIPVRWLVQNLAEVEIYLGTNLSSLSGIRAVRSQVPATADEYFIAGFNLLVDPGNNVVAGKQQAIQKFTKAIQLNSKYQHAYFLRGFEYYQAQEFEKSLTDLNQAILINPKFSQAYYNRAVLKYEKNNDIQGALADFNQAILINPRNFEAYINRGLLKYEKINDTQGALADFNQAIFINPRNFEAYINRGLLKYEKINDIQGALADYNQAIFINPRIPHVYNNRANLKTYQLNDVEGGMADYDQAILIDPKYSLAYFNRANLKFYKQKNVKGALDDYNQAILINPRESQFYYGRAVLKYEKLNDINGVLADLNQAILINPQYSQAYNVRAALKYEKLNDIKGALADFNQAILINPQYSNAYHNRAILKADKLNDLQGAIQDLRQAAKLFRKEGNSQDLQIVLQALQKLGATE